MKTIIPSTKISISENNVLAVIGDQKLPVLQGGVVVSFEAHVISSQDYSPFGVTLSGRSWSAGYRYGFQNQETDDELWGGAINYKYRVEDPRLGRFFSVDPLFTKYPYYSTYQFSGNRLIDMVELEGLEPARAGSKEGDYDIAEDQVECGNYGWTWDGCDWQRGSSTDFRTGNAWQDSKDGDLNCEFYADQIINDWQNCKDELNSGEDCHLKNFRGMFSIGIMLESDAAKAEAMSLFYHFCEGGEGDFTTPLFFGEGSEIARILKEDAAFASLTSQFKEAANAYLAAYGSLNGFQGNEFLRDLRKSESCSYMKDTWFMHTIMGGYCQVDVSIIGVSKGKVVLSTTIYDHFGAGRNDANVRTPGLPSMYYLQHNTPSDNNYKPFVWAVKVR